MFNLNPFKFLKRLIRKEDSHEFKPILAEIEESPASPLALTTFWIVLSVFVFAVLWMFMGEVDVVITGRGKVIPKGKVKILQPLETGVVKKIIVEPGDHVEKGQLLISIDTAMSEPELESAESNLSHLEMEQTRIQANLSKTPFNVNLKSKESHSENEQDALKTQQQLYRSAQESLQAQLAAKQASLDSIEQQLQQTEVEIAQNESILTMGEAKERRLKAVLDIIAKKDYEEVQQEIITSQKNIERLTHRLDELTYRQREIGQEMSSIRQSHRKELLTELSDKQKQISQLKARREGSAFTHARHQITSPVTGYVNELFIHTVGGVVTPAEKLISIVPETADLIIQARISNQDIGFVKDGMPVAIKVDTFSFQKYGMLDGQVIQIAKDSKISENDPSRQEEIYEVMINPLEKQLMVEGVEQNIKTGMTVSADIKVGKRKIIEFFVYPLVKYLNEGISVR